MEVVTISQRTSRNLAELNRLPKPVLASLCKYFLQMIVTGRSAITLEPSMDSSLCAISTLLLESAKAQASAEQVRAILVEQGVNGEVSGALADLFAQHRETLIEHISETGIAAPMIVDLDWRLDYHVRSKHGGRENKPMFFVSLKVKDRGIVRDVDMVATQEELQDLFNKVRDAVKQVERVLNTADP